MMKLRGKAVTVVGLGISGVAACRFLKSMGADVVATDGSSKKEVLETAGTLRLEGIPVETGSHTDRFIDRAKLIVTSPGVPKSSPPLKRAKQKKIPVISEIELGSYFCKAPIIAVTGSNGKTTTSHLIHEIIAGSGGKAALCGNVGRAFLSEVASLDSKSIAVLELSSFQLEDSPTFRPQTAVVLNIAPNHLDRHKTLKAYILAKERIFANQRKNDILALNADDATVKKMARRARSRVIFFSKGPLKEGVYHENGFAQVRVKGLPPRSIDLRGVKLLGAHNLENILAALAAVASLELPQALIEATLRRFTTLEHRIEPVGERAKVRYVNDSKSTTVESTMAALRAVEAPVVLIAGGRDKGVDFATVEPLIRERVKAAVLYGEAREKIRAAWPHFKTVTLIERFGDAVRAAAAQAGPGDTVLLSPMCTSFDQFSCYEERGEVFKNTLRTLGVKGARHGSA